MRHQLDPRALQQAHVGQAVSEYVEDARLDVLTKHAPTLIRGWAKVIEAADAHLAAARDAIPGVDLRDPHYLSTLRPAQMTPWGEARKALGSITTVEMGWTYLVTGCRLGHFDPNHVPSCSRT